MAYQTDGGSSGPTNQGATSADSQKKAITEIEDKAVSETLLSTNYAQQSNLIDNQNNLTMADWYRYGQPSTLDAAVFDRLPRIVEIAEEEPAAIHVFGLPPKGTSESGDVELLPRFTKFILESTAEGHAERSQISETFGSFYVFFFGERPPVYNFSGTLINTKDINWRQDFQFYYDNYLRGTKCVDRNARIVLTYGGRQIEGFMLNFQTTTDAAVEAGVKVTFQIIVTNRLAVLGLSQDFGLFNQNGQQFGDETFQKLLEDIAGKEGKGLAAGATSVAYGQTTKAMAGGPSIEELALSAATA